MTASQLELSCAEDTRLLTVAQGQERVLVTRDRDFGALVFVQDLGGGVIYLRFQPRTIEIVHSELRRILSTYSEEDLICAFVTVEPGRHRFRKIGTK
ncbi:MAG: DUF5615 family PIN-like protein [Planctomycetota bacterium]|nr:DUF5615 family PIN-like protein [Planctomycetota bacterium]MDA1137886.1 DUF5615 family PIN-like protein [Planctomycetota bacterium]